MQQASSASQSALTEGIAKEGGAQSADAPGVQAVGAEKVVGHPIADTVMHRAVESPSGGFAGFESLPAIAQLQASVVVCCREQAVSRGQ